MKKIIMTFAYAILLASSAFSQSITFSQNDLNIKQTAITVTDERTGEEKTLGQAIFELVLELLFIQNMHVNYLPCPDAEENYIDYFSPNEPKDPPYKSWRYEIETGALYFPVQKLLGNESRIEGSTYHFFGPLFENQLLKKLDGAYDDISGNLKLGIQFFIFQTNTLSASWNIQWNHLYGNCDANGFNIGLTLKSYILKRLLLEARFNISDILTGEASYSDKKFEGDTIFESHIEAGTMLSGPYEIYASCKFVQNGFTQKKSTGICAGIKRHF